MKTHHVQIWYSGAELAMLTGPIEAEGWEIEESRPGSVKVQQDLADDEFEVALRRLQRVFPRWHLTEFVA
jgi:hypothetical protein